MRIFFFSIKSYIREIVPYREERCIDKIGEKKLVEHENNTKWYDEVLCSHDISIKVRRLNTLSIKKTVFKECKKGTDLEYISLLYHIDYDCRK